MSPTLWIELGIEFLQTFLGKTKAAIPAELAASIEATIAALEAHKGDLLTKDNFEAQRG